MNISLLLTILSSLIFLFFFVIYNRDILKGSIKPNIVTWGIFSLITFANFVTYFTFTGDIFKSALAFTDFFVCIVITLLILFKGQYTKLTILEKIAIFVAVLSLIVWCILHSAVYANLLLQPAYILAFVPTLKNAWKDPKAENALVWFMWAFSFVLIISVIIIRFDNNFADFINPCIALILHGSVGVLALRKYRN